MGLCMTLVMISRWSGQLGLWVIPLVLFMCLLLNPILGGGFKILVSDDFKVVGEIGL